MRSRLGKHSLIVCPASVVPVWESEARRWYPSMTTAILRSGETLLSDASGQPEVVDRQLYPIAPTQAPAGRCRIRLRCADEAQQIKNPEAKVTHACCAIRAECRIALTGTPLENRLLDLWTLFRFLMPGLLGSRARFEEAAQLEDPQRRAFFEQRLRRQIAPFILRRQKDAVSTDLPPKVEMDLICPISDLQRQVYEGLLNQGREELGDDLQAAMQTQTMNFLTFDCLRQACCDRLIPDVDAGLGQSGKIQTLLTHLERRWKAAAPQSSHLQSICSVIDAPQTLIRENSPASLLELTGRTRDRAKPVETFQTQAGPAVILVSLRAGGAGITLHAADYVFLLDPWWNPRWKARQSTACANRSAKRVFVYRMITTGTIEERIQQLKSEKRELFESTLGQVGAASD